MDAADDALEEGYEKARQAQCDAWKQKWEMADVQIEGDDSAQQGIRFNLFQLLSTYTGEDARLNIGPKGFTGRSIAVPPTGIPRLTASRCIWRWLGRTWRVSC